MAFQYHSENGKTLTRSQEELLETIENLPFSFDGLSTFCELRRRTGVTVVISDRMSLKWILMDCIRSIKTKIEGYKTSGIIRNGNVEGEIYERLRWAERQLGKAEQPQAGDTPLLGLYSRKLLWFDNSAPVVYLFADNIRDYAVQHPEMDEDNVFAFVFVHEMMHAYYDAFNSVGFPAKEPIEEAFAEFGMLSFIYKSFGSHHDLFFQARSNVCSKIENGPQEYGFGLDLFDLSGGAGTDMIQKYKDISNWIDYSVISKEFRAKGLGNYFWDIADYKNHIGDDDFVEKCFKDIQDILNFPWQMPPIIVQPRVSTCRTSSLSSPSDQSKRMPPISLIYCSPTQTDGLVCLIRDKDIANVLAAVIRVLKHEGFEASLSFHGIQVHYSGKVLFNYATSSQTRYVSRFVVPESICVSGTTVFPMFHRWSLTKTFSSVIHLLSELVGESFVLVGESGGYGLYGPPLNDEYKSILAPEPIQYGKHRYDVIVRATSELLGQNVGKYKVPLLVVKHFCESNKDITWKDLQIAFDPVECHMSKYLDWITPKPIVEAYYSSFPPPGGNPIRLFHDDPIHLASGETILVVSRFMSDYQFDFSSFLKVADNLGYEIREH